MPAREEDFDWLYGRDADREVELDRTRVMPTVPADEPAPWPAPRPVAPTDPRTARAREADRAPRASASAASVAAPVRPAPASHPVPADRARGAGGSGSGAGGPGPGGAGGSPGARPRRRRHPVRTVIAVLVVLIIAWLAWLVAVPMSAFAASPHVASDPSGKRPAAQPGTTYLLVGSDSRAGMTSAEKKELGTGTVAGQRTDTIMLLYVPKNGKPALISIPRDSYVAIPGHGKNKINAAFAFGGAPLLIQTIEQDTGVRVDHYAEIGFDGFAELVDAVGGVNVCLTSAMKDDKAHINLPKGCQTLDGPKALGYVRARYSDPNGDLGRVQRQREVTGKIAKKAATPATVLNPLRYWRIVHAGADALTFGDGTGLTAMPTLATALLSISKNQGLTLTVPVATSSLQTSNAGVAVQWDDAKAKQLFGDIASGDSADLARFASS